MAMIVKLDFSKYDPTLTTDAQAAFESWRQVKDDLIHSCRKVDSWAWAGAMTQEINAVKRLCRDFPQPVSEKHMGVILKTVSDFYPNNKEPKILPLLETA